MAECMRCGKTQEEHFDCRWCPDQDREEIELFVSGNASDVEDPSLTTSELFYQFASTAYVNVYEVTQAYGGREEGGWWYDCGMPLESVVVEGVGDRDAMVARLRNRYSLDAEGRYIGDDRYYRYGKTSCAGGADVEIRVEYEFAQPWPRTKPHYE